MARPARRAAPARRPSALADVGKHAKALERRARREHPLAEEIPQAKPNGSAAGNTRKELPAPSSAGTIGTNGSTRNSGKRWSGGRRDEKSRGQARRAARPRWRWLTSPLSDEVAQDRVGTLVGRTAMIGANLHSCHRLCSTWGSVADRTAPASELQRLEATRTGKDCENRSVSRSSSHLATSA